jgi:hypothetical protein
MPHLERVKYRKKCGFEIYAAGRMIGDSSTCSLLASSSSAATLAPGASCTNLISFTPTAVGSVSGS